ncbi:MAG: ABC transporter permease subunit, partial [SAR324 cluster bacterium]|nr:ABC transporter permease subunit [SAR324 cluster bacterium]
MAIPVYATPLQRLWHYIYLTICALVLFFLVMPLIAVIPISFSSSPFLQFTSQMLAFEPEAYSLRWYKMLIGDCSDPGITTVCTDRWVRGAQNSLFIGIIATFLATTLGIMASLGLSRSHMPFRKVIMAIMISPLVVPLIITASGLFFFFAKLNLVATYTGLIFAHTVLGLPFVVITVTATLVGFDQNLTRAGASLGGSPFLNFFKIQMPLILPGVIS